MDLLATIQPGGEDRLAGLLASLRAHRRTALVVAVVGSLGAVELDALGALTAHGTAVMVATRTGTQPPPALVTWSGLVAVDRVPGTLPDRLEPGNDPMASRTSSALATLALAALSTAAVLTLGRVFASGRFVLPAVGAVLLAHVLGFVAAHARLVTRRRALAVDVRAGRVPDLVPGAAHDALRHPDCRHLPGPRRPAGRRCA